MPAPRSAPTVPPTRAASADRPGRAAEARHHALPLGAQRRDRTPRSAVLVALLTLLTLLTLIALPPLAAAQQVDATGHVVTVAPNGSDDTAALQAALEACGLAAGPCTVALAEGTFHTRPLLVHDFVGTLRGAGRSATTVETLVADVSDAEPLLAEAPTIDAPWPFIVSFVGGVVAVEDLTFRVAQEAPTTGWNLFGFEFDAMVAAILVTGRRADARIERVGVEGGPGGFSGTNLINGIYVEGILPDGTTPWEPGASLPLTGTFVIRDSVFANAGYAMATTNLRDSVVVIEGNTFEASPVVEGGASDIDLLDHIDTVTVVRDNRILDDRGFGIHVAQGDFVDVDGVGVYLIEGNEIRAGDGSTAIALDDRVYGSGGAPTLAATASANRLELSAGGRGIFASAADRVRILDTVITGADGTAFALGTPFGDDGLARVAGWVLAGTDLTGFDAAGATTVVGPGATDTTIVCGSGESVDVAPEAAGVNVTGCPPN